MLNDFIDYNFSYYFDVNSVEQVDNRLGIHEITHILWNSNVHYHVQKSVSEVSILSYFRSHHQICFFKNLFNIFLPFISRFPKRFSFSYLNVVEISDLFRAHVLHILHSQSSFTVNSKERANSTYMLWSISLCNFLNSVATSYFRSRYSGTTNSNLATNSTVQNFTRFVLYIASFLQI